MKKSDIGMIGLAVMGRNLALNIADHGYTVSVFNRTIERVTELTEGCAKSNSIIGAWSLAELVSQLEKPRRVMMMVKADKPVDDLIDSLILLLEPGDIIIDGGNSNHLDTTRRIALVESQGLLFIGAGVSGGGDGARNGPSIMPGGSQAAWPFVKPIFQAICAKDKDGTPCCEWVGEGGAGHFVKMVHNGIKFGEMQLICEAYQLMRDVLKMTAAEMHKVFKQWNETELNSYLLEITCDILAHQDKDGLPLVDKILDTVGLKGTGRMTAATAISEAVPLTIIGEAVFSRSLSAMKEERLVAARTYAKTAPLFIGDNQAFIEQICQSLYAAKIILHAQSYILIRSAARSNNWTLNYSGIALMWSGGCIIRSALSTRIKAAYDRNGGLASPLLDFDIRGAITKALPSWRQVIAKSALQGVPIPAMSSALSFFDGYTCEHLSANLLQAQRDCFGAHTYERLDAPRGKFFHTQWTDQDQKEKP